MADTDVLIEAGNKLKSELEEMIQLVADIRECPEMVYQYSAGDFGDAQDAITNWRDLEVQTVMKGLK